MVTKTAVCLMLVLGLAAAGTALAGKGKMGKGGAMRGRSAEEDGSPGDGPTTAAHASLADVSDDVSRWQAEEERKAKEERRMAEEEAEWEAERERRRQLRDAERLERRRAELEAKKQKEQEERERRAREREEREKLMEKFNARGPRRVEQRKLEDESAIYSRDDSQPECELPLEPTRVRIHLSEAEQAEVWACVDPGLDVHALNTMMEERFFGADVGVEGRAADDQWVARPVTNYQWPGFLRRGALGGYETLSEETEGFRLITKATNTNLFVACLAEDCTADGATVAAVKAALEEARAPCHGGRRPYRLWSKWDDKEDNACVDPNLTLTMVHRLVPDRLVASLYLQGRFFRFERDSNTLAHYTNRLMEEEGSTAGRPLIRLEKRLYSDDKPRASTLGNFKKALEAASSTNGHTDGRVSRMTASEYAEFVANDNDPDKVY